MKKLFLLLILSFFSAQGLAAGCPDGSEPVKSVSADGTYFVYNCGGSAASSSEISKKTTISVKAQPTELEMSGKSIGQFNFKKLSENTNPKLGAFVLEVDKFDINQDGYDDLIVAMTTFNTDDRNQPNEFSKPVILFWDNNIKEYIVDEEVQKSLPFLYYPRRIHGSINPKTGLTHIFIADTGFDLADYDFSKGLENLPPNCGGQNHLITYDPSSGRADEIQLPKLWDFSHAIASTDLNGDQIVDYVILNSPFIKYPTKCSFKGADYTNENYILYSNKNGDFDKFSLELNYKGYSKAPHYTSGTAIVDKNDTYLLLGGEGTGSGVYALKQDSKTSFTETSRVSAPEIMRKGSDPGTYSEVLFADVDMDGVKEVIASVNTSMWQGRYIQLLDFNNGKLTDRSKSVVQNNPALEFPSSDWCRHLYFNEETSWGQPILTCDNGSWQLDKARGSFYTWTNNKLQIAKIKAINISNWIRSMVPMTFDQKTVFVGRELTGERKFNGHSFYDTMIFNLIRPPLSKEELEAEKITERNKIKNELFGNLEASNAFDGNYSFMLSLTGTDGRTWYPGGGLIEIKNGILSVSKKGRTLKDVDSSTDQFDTFEGQIDKNGDFMAIFDFNACGPGDCEEELIELEGNINNNNKLTGLFLDKVIAFELKKVIDIKSIETSKTFDGTYAFKLFAHGNMGKNQLGAGLFEIKDGIITIATENRMLVVGSKNKFFDSFNGRVDKSGEVYTDFLFNPCGPGQCGGEKTFPINGTLDKHMLNGEFTLGTGPDVIKIIFELKGYDEALDLSAVEASDEFDGKYAFKLISNPPNITKHQIGSGYFEIKSGLITVSTKDRVLIASSNKFVTNKYYNKFEGRIDANGEIQANFFFNPCANGSKCYVQKEGQYNVAINDDKNITISGNIKTHKLTGEFTKGSGPDIVKIIFELED